MLLLYSISYYFSTLLRPCPISSLNLWLKNKNIQNVAPRSTWTAFLYSLNTMKLTKREGSGKIRTVRLVKHIASPPDDETVMHRFY